MVDVFLAPCPFCSSTHISIKRSEMQCVCSHCHAVGPLGQTLESAIYEWNTRTRATDYKGRMWMHCESGLTLTKASMSRMIMFCLTNDVEIGDIYAMSPDYPRSQVLVSVFIHPTKVGAFEDETGGKLRLPPIMKVN